MKSTRRALVSALLVIAASATATGAAAAREAESAPASGEKVTVYVVTDGDAASGTENVALKDGVTAGVEALNARGGLLGHPVELKFCENPFSIEVAVQCVTDAIADPTAIAFLANSTNAGEQIDPMLEAAGLPIIAGLGLTPTQQNSPNEFSLHMGAEMFPAAGLLLADNGAARIMIGSIQTEGTAGMEGLVQSYLGDAAEVVGTVALPIAKPDLSAEATKATNDADGIVMVTDAATMGRFAATLKQQGSELVLATGALTAGRNALEAAGDDMEGVRVAMSLQPATADVPGNEMLLADLEASGGEDSFGDEATANGWLSTRVLEQAAEAAGSVAPADLLAALNGMSEVDTYGFTEPIDFTAAPSYFDGRVTRLFNPYVMYGTVTDGEIVADTGEWINITEGA